MLRTLLVISMMLTAIPEGFPGAPTLPALQQPLVHPAVNPRPVRRT
jgi:hypothetical protein